METIKNSTKSFIARNKLRLFVGLAFLGFATSMANWLVFAKVWAGTFEYCGIPPVAIYAAIIPGVVIMAFIMGYAYDRLNLWGLEVSYQNSKQINPEFARMCEIVEENNKLLKKLVDSK
ncbi:MAG: hypothetical protein WCE63_19520 [Acidobacteriaceae bacterium]